MKWTTLMIAGLAGALCVAPVFAHEEGLDPDSGTVTMADSDDVNPSPGGGGTIIVVNPTAACTYDAAPSGRIADAMDAYLACVEAGIGDGYYAHRTASHEAPPDKLQFNVGNRGGTLPDLQVVEQDPNIQTVTIDLPQPDMQLRIGGFAQDPSAVGGDVILTIDAVTIQFSTTGLMTADLVTKELRDQLVREGFLIEYLTKPGPMAIIVHRNPAQQTPQYVKLQIKDPALITTNLRFEPYAGPPPRGGQ